jgi:hypothetical protein
MIADIDVTATAESRMLTGRRDAVLLRYAGIVRHIAYHLFPAA